MSEYLAKDGTPITDDMVDAWARQAEEGFADIRRIVIGNE